MAGTCAGIAGYSGLDVTPVRVIVTVVSVFTGGTAALAYLAAWLIIPGEGEKTSIAQGILGKKSPRASSARRWAPDRTGHRKARGRKEPGHGPNRPDPPGVGGEHRSGAGPDHLASTWRPTPWWLLASRRWTGPRPINAYVVEHRDGLVLFDAGQDRASVTDPGYFPGGMTGVLYGRLARFAIGPAETLTSGLGRLGYAAGDVSTAVLSHLHQDHIGGLAELSHADIVVSQAEWDTLSRPLPQLRGLMRRHIDLPGLRWRRIEPELSGDAGLAPFWSCHDLFGDGSLLLLPTPGHTPGSISLLVRRPGRPALMMVGDVTYDADLLELGHVPGSAAGAACGTPPP